jgi:uncharacterized protein involved in exopolysaccharide biosynthesis
LVGLVAGALAGVGANLVSTPIYRAQAKLLPPQVSSNVASNLMMVVGGSGDLAASAAGQKNPSELYIGILRSRSVLLPIIAAHQLEEHYKAKTTDDAELRLNANLFTTLGKDGIIVIEVTDKLPELAATLCNAVIEEMYVVSRRLAIDERERREKFYAPWLNDARTRLAKAEATLKSAEMRTGLSRIKGQEESLILSAAELQSQITLLAATAKAMRAYAANANPELQRLEAQLSALRGRLSEMDRQVGGVSTSLHVPLSAAAEIAEEVGRLRRDAKLQENLLDIVSRIAELSKVDETRDLSLIKVLDHAKPPSKPVSPRMTINVVLGSGVGLFFVFAFILIRHQLSSTDPTGLFWQEVKRSLKGRP